MNGVGGENDRPIRGGGENDISCVSSTLSIVCVYILLEKPCLNYFFFLIYYAFIKRRYNEVNTFDYRSSLWQNFTDFDLCVLRFIK